MVQGDKKIGIEQTPISVFWFRRDLRLEDNAGLYHALKSGAAVLPVFIFDTNILEELEEKADKRVDFIYQVIQHLQQKLEEKGSTLLVFHDSPIKVFKQLTETYIIQAVYANEDHEPYARMRDEEITGFLLKHNIPLYSYKDQVIFSKNEILKGDRTPYTVYTPYSKQWKAKLNTFYLKPYPTEKYFKQLLQTKPKPIPSLTVLGFKETGFEYKPPHLDEKVARHYDATRDYPAMRGTTRLSMHLRFGTISIRQLTTDVKALNEKLLNELIWRDFYQMILWHHPHIVAQSFKKEYDNIKWRNNEQEFERWCNGTTGYPVVDAGIRELNATGFMHNRVRMIVASFLTKHLLIDWRWGEAYFAKKLLDYDLASNNGGWQWAAGSGCDAAPYFRIFNPYIQTEKFDAKLEYIKKWIPELETAAYPKPVVVHEAARQRCLEVYKAGLNR